jgi:nicotinate-nucleotide adenylyltransferase
MSTAPRIGLFGGTFDPPHLAHVALARAAMSALALNRLMWIPAGQPWQKTRVITAAEHREAMVSLAIGSEPGWVLERCELQRSGPSYMLDTVQTLQQRGPAGATWFLVIGEDQLAGLHTWHRFEALLQRVTLAVAGRPGQWPALDPRVQALAAQAVPLPPMPHSATQVRAMASRGEDISGLVPAPVARYIAQHRLYAGG